MNQITIGIPRAYLYYRYHIFWENFFKHLGCKVIVGSPTTKKTIEVGKQFSIDESCLSSKIYLGHVVMLKDKCDYILITRVHDYGKNEQVCVKFNAIYDIVKNVIPNIKIIDYNIEKSKNPIEILTYIRLGFKVNHNFFKVLYAYFKSKKEHSKYVKKQIKNQLQKLNDHKLKILLVAHPYNIYDDYIGKPIIKKLESMGVEIIYAHLLESKTAKQYAKKFSPTLYWTYSKELIGAIGYYQYSVNGIIFLTTFPCGPDSLVNELMMRKIENIPITNILIDEQSSSTGLETRLESFIDIIKEREDNYE